MTILVDGDACPVKGIIEKVAKVHKLPVIIFIDTSHELNSGYCEVVQVSKGADSADFALVNRCNKGDIVVTGDYGVATMAMAKQGFAISFSGICYTDENIDRLLFERHLSKKVRSGGGRTKNMKKRTGQDDDTFEKELEILIKR